MSPADFAYYSYAHAVSQKSASFIPMIGVMPRNSANAVFPRTALENFAANSKRVVGFDESIKAGDTNGIEGQAFTNRSNIAS